MLLFYLAEGWKSLFNQPVFTNVIIPTIIPTSVYKFFFYNKILGIKKDILKKPELLNPNRVFWMKKLDWLLFR